MRLPRSPLTVVGRIERCWLFTYQTPVEAARALLPPPLTPVTKDGRAFWNVVACELHAMRPKGVPSLFGLRYRHVAYRLYAHFTAASGETIEGLYFVRSDADSPLVARLGNLLTDFRFHTARITLTDTPEAGAIDIASPDAPARVRIDRTAPPELPPHSAFVTLDDAAAFLKYKPFGLSPVSSDAVSVVRITRDERARRSRLVTVTDAGWTFFKGRDVKPEICYDVEPITYQWNRGRTIPARR